jgi:chemotaxis response regulator CheB
VIRTFLLDDEALAIKRLKRMLEETGKVEVVGSSCDPV